MYTLINKSRTLCCGLFPTQTDATRWANQAAGLSGVALEPIELIVHADGTETIDEFDAYTLNGSELPPFPVGTVQIGRA